MDSLGDKRKKENSITPIMGFLKFIFFSFGDVEREEKRRDGDCMASDDVDRSISLEREGEAQEERKKGNFDTKNTIDLMGIKKI